MRDRRKKIRRYLLAGILVLTAVTGFAGWRLARRHGQRVDTAQHLRGILGDLWGYHDVWFSRLPDPVVKDLNGRPLYSWRFANAALLLGDPVQTVFYGQYAHRDQPWDSPANRRYTVPPYREYMGSPLSYIDPNRPGSKARFVAIVGPGTAFGDGRPANVKKIPGSTILVVEVKNCRVHWMEPGGDLDVRTMARHIGAEDGTGIGGIDPCGFFVGFADGSAWLIRNDVPFEELAKFFLTDNPGVAARDRVLGPYRIRLGTYAEEPISRYTHRDWQLSAPRPPQTMLPLNP